MVAYPWELVTAPYNRSIALINAYARDWRRIERADECAPARLLLHWETHRLHLGETMLQAVIDCRIVFVNALLLSPAIFNEHLSTAFNYGTVVRSTCVCTFMQIRAGQCRASWLAFS